MNPFLQQMINQKINQLTTDELIHYANNYGITLTKQEAKNTLTILKSEKLDINNKAQHKRLLKEISKNVHPKTAKKIQSLFNQFYHMM